MLPTAAALEVLEAKFGMSALSESGEVTVICQNCHHRGMTPDKAGHLGLNIGKNVGYCVRCGWSCGNLQEWLSKIGVDVTALIFNTHNEVFAIFKEDQEPPELKSQNLPLPFGTRTMGERDWATPGNIFAESLRQKNLTWDVCQYWPITLCEQGFYAGYVIFPFVEGEDIVYWQGRAALDDLKLRKINPSKKNCKLGKKSWLYGYSLCSRGCHLYLVEGTLDQISLQWFLWQTYGPDHVAVAIQGTSLSFPHPEDHYLNSQFGQILALKPASVTFVFDADAYDKAKAISAICTRCGVDSKCARILGKDPNESSPADIKSAIEGNEWSWASLALGNAKF